MMRVVVELLLGIILWEFWFFFILSFSSIFYEVFLFFNIIIKRLVLIWLVLIGENIFVLLEREG